MTDSITGHMVVKNEDRFIWYAVNSILPYVAELIIFDTGSTDKTVKIIESIKDPKIKFFKKSISSPVQLVNLRLEQIKLTKTPWIWIIDGDEVYPQNLGQKVVQAVRDNPQAYGLILHRYDLLGDIYHYQDERVGAYDQFGKKGHYVLRLINKSVIPGLTIKGIYPMEYYAFANGKSIKTAGKEKFVFMEQRLWHAMYLKRSTRGGNLGDTLERQKYKIELGKTIDRTSIPEFFFQDRSGIVPDVSQKRSIFYILLANMLTPLIILKRQFI